MNVLKRRALILTLLVLCLFGLTILGASAAVDSTTAATEASADSVASATVTVGSATPAVYYYTDLATAIAEADADTVVTVLQDTSVTSSIAIDKNLTVKSTDGSTFTVTKDAANTGYLFVVSGGAQFTISNINVATDGGFVDASGLTGTVTVGDGATVSGASSANPFFKVDTAATGTIAMASGSTLRVTSAPAAVTLFDINASLGKIDLNGNIVVGTETEPLALSADSVLFDVVSAATITTADFNGDIDVYAKSKKITFWQGGTAAINFKGVIDFHVTEYYLASDNGPMIQFLKDRDTAGTAKPLTITVNGGSINMTFGNAGVSGNSQTTGQTNNSAGYSAVFYMYNSASTLTVDNGSITAGASGHGFPMFYADVAFAVTVKGNSVLAQNGTNSSARIYAGGTSNATTFTVLADTNGTPVIKGSSSAVLFKSSITLAGDSVVIAGGTGFSYKTTTVTNMYFTTDAIAAAFGYAYRVNEQTLGGDGEYATAKKGYYKTLSEAQAAATGSGDVIYSAATGNVAFDSFDDDAAAIAAGFKFRVGALTNKLYAADLASAIDLAANNDTIYVLADVTVSTAVTLSGKAITIEGVTSSIKLTASATITMGAGAGLTIKNLAITLTVSPFIQVNAAASSLTLTDASIASDAERLTFRVTGGSANLAALTMTNVTLTGKAMVARVENGGTLASAAAPATITNLTTNYLMFYAYTAKLYVNVFGGSVGALVYGGDNHVNTIDVKYNPTGDTSTNISLASTSEYGSYVYQNPNGNTGAVLSFSFRNVTLVNTPTSAKGRIFHIPAVATITISAENSTFTTTAGQYVNFNSKINFNSDATARAFECGARVGDTEGLTASYYADVYTALGTVADGGTIWIIGNVKQTSEYTLTKSVTIKGINAQSVYTVTTSGNVPFFVQTNATLKFENVTYTLGARLARMDGNNSSLILASGAVMNHNGGGTGIFIYNNGNCDATPTYTIDFQAGSTVNATGALGNGLIYHNSADAAGTTATVYFNGTVKVTGNYPLVKDVDNNGQYTVYIDVSKVTCGATAWFSNVLHQIDAGGYATRLYAKGFASTEAAAAWGYSIGATAMTYSADPSKEWNYMFVNHGSMTYSQWENYLNSYGGEMWQLRSANDIWWTHRFENFGTVTMKSYNNATITMQDGARIQVTNTTLILDGIKMTINSTVSGGAGHICVNAGTAAKPSTVKLINGAVVTGPAWQGGQLMWFKGAYTNLYVDATSSITQTAPASAINGNTYVIYLGGWENGSISVEGTISSAAEAGGKTSLISANGSGNNCTILLDGGTISVPETDKTVYTVEFASGFNGMLKFTGDLPAHTVNMNMRVGDKQYFATLAGAISLGIPTGGEGTVTAIAPITTAATVAFSNKNVTIVADGNHAISYTGTGDFFQITNLGTLTFNGLNLSTSGVLVRYLSASSSMAKADRDIVINLVNTHITANGAANELITSYGHHDNVTDRMSHSVTFNMDADSQIDFTTSSTGDVKFIRYDHNSHDTVYANIHGTVNVTVTGDSETAGFYFVRSNNPSTTQITVSETAKITITLPAGRQASGASYFTSSTGGNNSTNKLNLHLDAISDNGALTLGGVKLFANWNANCGFDITITANDTSMESILTAWQTQNNLETLDATDDVLVNPITFRTQVGNTYVYGTLNAMFAAAENEGTVTAIANCTVTQAALLSGKTVTLTALENVVVTNTSTTYFVRMGSNSVLNVENLKYQGNCFLSFTNPNGPATLNLNDGAIIEGGDPTANYIITTESDAKGAITITIGEKAELVRPASHTLSGKVRYSYSLINFSNNATSNVTLDIYGKFANLTTIADGAETSYYNEEGVWVSDHAGVNATLLYHNLANSTFNINIYDGSHVEGTCNNSQHSGNYSGLFYFAVNGNNTSNLNIYGGTITSHGVNPLAYMYAKASNMKIEGAPKISMPDLAYGMVWFGSNVGTSLTLGLEEGYEMNINGKGYYATAANAPVVLAVSGIIDAEAIAQGMFFRYNDVYYETLAAAIALIPDGGEGTVYVLGDVTCAGTATITNKKVTVTSVGTTKYTVSLSGNPNFNMDNNSYLIIDNVKILCAGGFAKFVNADTTSTAKLELNADAEVEIQHYTGGYFVYGAAGMNTGILTVNLKQGSSVKLLSDGTVSGAQQGLFQFWSTVSGSTADAHKVAAGSTITVDGTIIYGLTFDPNGTSGTNRAAMFKMSDNTLSLFINEHADIQLRHTNAIAGSWNNIVCMDSSVAATQVIFNGGKYTIAEGCGLIGLNGSNFPGTYEIKNGAIIQGDSDFLVSEYTGSTGTTLNTTVILFQDVNIGSFRVAQNNMLPNTVLVNVGFTDVAAARANYATARIGADATQGYYSNLSTAAAALQAGDILYDVTVGEVALVATFDSDADAIAAGFPIRIGALEDKLYVFSLQVAIGGLSEGKTIYILADITADGYVLTGANMTIEGVGNVTINATTATGALFTLASSADANTTLTLKNLTITLGANNLVLANSATVNNGAHTVVAEGLTVTANADKAIFHLNSTAANLDVIDNGSTYTAQYLFYISNAGALDFDLTGTTIRATIYRSADDASGTGGTLGSATDPVTLTDVILEPNNGVASGGFAFRRSTPAFIEVYGGHFNLRSVAYNAPFADTEASGAGFIGSRDGYAPVIDVKIAKSATSGTEFHIVGWATNYSQYTNIVSMNGSGADPTITFEASDASFKSYSNRCYFFAVWGTASANFEFTDCSFDNANGPGTFYFGSTAYATLNSCTLVSGTVNSFAQLSFGDDATAIAFGAKVRVGDTASGKVGVVYFTDLYDALMAAPTDDGNGGATNVYVFADTTQRSTYGSDAADGTGDFNKKVNVIGIGETAPTVSNNNHWYYFGDGAELTFINVTLEVKALFARGDGDFKLVFGNKCTVNNADTIFFWDKGDGGAATYTFEIQAGAVLNVTGALDNAIFYDNASGSDGKALGGTNVTIKIAGTINTNNKPIASDVNENGYYTIYYDARTASINTGTSAWFAGTLKNGVMFYQYANFETMEAGAAWGYATGATGMTYNNDPAAEWKYSFTYANQFTHTQHNVLNSNGGEIWQLRNAGSIYQTMEFKNEGTVTIKSYQGATITLQDVVRFRVQSTTLILDGITINLNGGSSIGIHGGSAAAPSMLKLVNGAKLTGAAANASQMIYFMTDNGGQYSHLYVDETSSIEQTAPSAALANNSYVVWVHGGWANGSITIKGTVTTASSAANVYLFTLNGNGENKLTLDGATLSITGEADGNAMLIQVLGGCMLEYENINNSTLDLSTATAANKKALLVQGAIKFKGLSNTEAAEMAASLGLNIGYNGVYSEILSTAIINQVPVGGKAEFQIVGTMVLTNPIEIHDREIVLIGNNNADYDIKFEGAADSVAFIIYSRGILTFKNMNIWTKAQLVSYNANRTVSGEKSTKNVVINFVNTDVTATITSRYAKDVGYAGALISSSNHYSRPEHGGCGEQAYSVTVNIDKDSVINFTTSTTYAWFIAFNHNSHDYAYANIEGQVIMNATYAGTDSGRTTYLVRSNNPAGTYITITETAKIKVTLTDALKGTDNAIANATTGTSINNRLYIHLDAITENGALTLDGMKLFSSLSTGNAYIARITANDNTMSDVLMSWTAKVGDAMETPLSAYLEVDGKHYFSTLGGVIEMIPDGSTATITISSSITSGDTIVITNKTITLEGIGATKPTLTLTGNPAFQLGDNSHLIFKNLNIIAKSNFIYTNGTSTTAYTKVDIEGSVAIDVQHYTGAYFLRTNSVGVLTMNIKTGSSIKQLTDGTGIDVNPQGMFDFTTYGSKVAEGSVINVDGQIIYGLKFTGTTAGTNRSAMFKLGDNTIDVIFTENADIQLLHENALAGTWNAIVCLDVSSASTIVTFNGCEITLADQCTIYGLNGANYPGTYEVNNITLMSSGSALVSDWAPEGGINTTLIKFRDFAINGNAIAQNDKLPYAVLMNITFASETEAFANAAYFTLTPGTYSNLAGAIEAADDGATIYVNTNLELTSATITGKTLTFAGAVDGIIITNKSTGYLFTLGSNGHLIVENLTYQGNYFAQFTAAAGTTSSLTLGDGAYLEGGALETDAFMLFGNDLWGEAVITIGANAAIIRPSTYVLNDAAAASPLIYRFQNNGYYTMNVYGQLKNQTTIVDGVRHNAGIGYCNSRHGMILNIYDGADIEATVDSTQHNGYYQGAFYFAVWSANKYEFNIYGGTIVSRGINALAYFGNNYVTVRIQGTPTILMPDLTYDMLCIHNLLYMDNSEVNLWVDVEEDATIDLHGRSFFFHAGPENSKVTPNKFFTDDNAAQYGFGYRVVDEEGNTWYAASLNSAVALSRNGGVIYLVGDVNEYNAYSVLDKYLFLQSVDGHQYTINFKVNSSAWGHAFKVTTGTKESPVRMYISNVNFSGTAQGSLFYLAENANGIFELTGCNMNGGTGLISLTGGSTATITLNKGTYKMQYTPFNAVDYSSLTVNAYDITFVATGTGNENSLFFLNNSATGVYNIKGGSATTAFHTFYTMDKSVAYANIENFSIVTNQWGFGSQSGTSWYVNLTNVNIHGNNTTTIRLYAAANTGSYMNIMGGTFTTSKADGTYPAVMTFGGSLTINIFDAYIVSEHMSCISGLANTINITIYGGTFIYNGTKSTYAPIMLPKEGNLTVKGGTFINTSGMGPVFSNTVYANNLLKLEAYNAISNSSNLTLNFSTVEGSAPTANLGAYGRLTLNTLMMTRGARPAFVGNAGALTFKSTVSKSAYEYMQSLAVGGEVKFGMLVIPTELLKDGVNFTHSGLANYSSVFGDKYELRVDYFDYKATASNLTFEDDGCVTIRLTHSDINAENYNTKYSVVFYAEYEVMAQIGTEKDGTPIYGKVSTTANGTDVYSATVYRYADYEESENARSLAEVAYAAYNNPAESFSDAQKALLKTWCGDQVAEKTLDIFLVAGGSNAVGNTPFSQQYAETLIDHVCTTCGHTADNALFAASNYTCVNTLVHGKPLTIKDGKCYCSCGYVYDIERGIPDEIDPDTGDVLTYIVAPGTPVEALPADLTCPATLTCGAAKATFQNVLKTTASNVFYSGIISQRAPQVFASTTAYATASQYIPVGSAPTLGLGWASDMIGPEYGMATELAKHYSGTKYAAIMKYAFNDAALVAEDAYYSNFSGELYKNFMQMVADQIAVYADLGYKVNIAGLYWMQGEADLDNASAYAAALQQLVTNARADLSQITGTDLSGMPVVVGEVATFTGTADNANRTALKNAQNTVTGVIIDQTSAYMADANGIFVDAQNVADTGARVAAKILNAKDSSITVPTIQNTTVYLDDEGNERAGTGHTSLAMSLIDAPSGTTIALKADQTVYTSMSVTNRDDIVIAGDGNTITVITDAPALALQNASVTLDKVVIDHNGNSAAITLDQSSTLVVEEDTEITAERTAIEMIGNASKLVINGGIFTTTSEDATTTDAIIRTTNANVTITDGSFNAASGSSIVRIEKNAVHKLIVNITGGNFLTTDKQVQKVDSQGHFIPGEYDTIESVAFVNNCPTAIMVIDPTVLTLHPDLDVHNVAMAG